MDGQAVSVTDRVLCLGVDSCQKSGADTEAECCKESDESGTKESESVRKQTRDPGEQGKAGADEDEVHGGLGVVAEVLAVTESGCGEEVLDLLPVSLRSVAEDGIGGQPFEAKVLLTARAVRTGGLTGAVVVKTPLVTLLEAVTLTLLSVGVVGVQVVDVDAASSECIAEASSVDRNVSDVTGDNVVGELANVGKDHEDDSGKSEELAYMDAKEAKGVPGIGDLSGQAMAGHYVVSRYGGSTRR